MSTSQGTTPAPGPARTGTPHAPHARQAPGAPDAPRPGGAALQRRLAALRGGPEVPQRPLDARALAALAANPGCHRRALLDGAGVDKAALAGALGAPAPFGQSQFAFVRGNAFEARIKGDGGAELVRLLCAHTGEPPPEPDGPVLPDLAADGPAGRAARTRLALTEAASGGWTLLNHPMLTLDVAGSTAYLEPDALAVHPDGTVTVVEIKSFPVLDGSADPAKVGAAARQAAVYALALERLAAEAPGRLRVRDEALLVCPKDFSNLPAAHGVDIRRQRATTRRQLARLARVADIAALLPEDAVLDPSRPAAELTASVAALPAAYAPECLASCELAFHCRAQARAAGAVESLGRSVRGELGGLRTIGDVLGAARPDGAAPEGGACGGQAEEDPAAQALRRAARLRAEALAGHAPGAPVPRTAAQDAPAAGPSASEAPPCR